MKKNIKLRNDFEISDEDFEKETEQFDKELDLWFQNHRSIIDEFTAFYISKGVEYNTLWEGSFEGLVNSSLDILSGYFVGKKLDREKFNKILLDKYGLVIVSEKPMKIKKA